MNKRSSCDVAESANMAVQVSSAGSAVALSSPEWSSNCTCLSTGRRPVLVIRVPEIVVGKACAKTPADPDEEKRTG
jgi:hypothetical protein